MKNLKKIIIFMTILILIIILLLIALLFTQKKEEHSSETISNIANEIQDISIVKDESEYHDIERIFNKYLSYINYLDYNYFQYQIKEEEKTQYKEKYLKKGKEALEQILLNQVTNKNNWVNELLSYTNKKMDITEMNKFNYNQISGYLLTINFDDKETTNIIIFVDESNNSFSILPDKTISTINKNNLTSLLEEININVIDKNSYNEFQKIKLNNEKICMQYYLDYLDMMKNDIDKLFNTLDEKYREKKFGNIEEFKKYINDNRTALSKAVLSKYEVKNKNNYNEYICVDEDGRYYIFKATAAMKYTLFLDTYTADLPDFTEKYNGSNNQEKIVLNIEKIFSAINSKDYKYVYSKLADSFKNNYFKDENTLKNFIEQNLYSKNNVEYKEFEREGTLATYKIKVEKEFEEGEELPEGKNAPFKYLNIVMQLNEGTDFVFSFNIIQ